MKARSNSIAFLFDHTDILLRSPTPYQQNPIPDFSKQASPNTDSNQLFSQPKKKKPNCEISKHSKRKISNKPKLLQPSKTPPPMNSQTKTFFHIQQRKIFRLSHHHFGRYLTPTEGENALRNSTPELLNPLQQPDPRLKQSKIRSQTQQSNTLSNQPNNLSLILNKTQ